ncbi:DUF305 domain-containing protein [Streptomyces sp. bgisy100]|uniref:DUF305 domain-containing protein n=1 Tax=Streptomyces sp. bgisy100 TaxID=3413783 RepID=UPI003D759149
MKSNRFPVRRATVPAVLTAVTALLLTACSQGPGSSSAHHESGPKSSSAPSASAPAGRHSAADVAFATGMVPHHRQAVEMAGLAATRAMSPEVKKLAKEVEAAQGPEIRTLSGWLTAWDVRVPGKMSGKDHSGMDHSGTTGSGPAEEDTDHTGHGADTAAPPGGAMRGMVDDAGMDRLRKASGRAFDTAFLWLMTEHHEGAVAMARTERARGTYGPAKAMAADIITAQNGEIRRMKRLLDGS